MDSEVILLLKENPVYTREEIAQKVGKTARTVQRSLDRLKEAKKIVRIGNKVSGYWEVID
ncbi:winged helix-turn-helix transcriptional regulator [Mycoplasmopsis arginini]|uniref:winged helix-turn-helix transcriptional regulator n=1 Tax=Mycoplasmopsis arginini TaxID=2094 RepID=UPI001CB77324|nr:winged helix-turn-helix transcriptional regulator [Mycoplasmopsis arginini]